MQKDIHYYMTFALALKAGIEYETARDIAWSDQYTDELKEADLHGLKTQCATIDDWHVRTVQSDVLVPFHFLPGDNKDKPWVVTPNCIIAQELCDRSVKDKDAIALGIALHSLQDTFSHQNWTGWKESYNACYWFGIIPIPTPNVGHTDMGIAPDIVSAVWTDPRTGETINNKIRAIKAAYETIAWLAVFNDIEVDIHYLVDIAMIGFWKIKSYDERKDWLMAWVNIPEYSRYKSYKPPNSHKNKFIAAARRQLALVQKMIAERENVSTD